MRSNRFMIVEYILASKVGQEFFESASENLPRSLPLPVLTRVAQFHKESA